MYKKQIGQQILFLLSIILCSYFFVRVDSLQCFAFCKLATRL